MTETLPGLLIGGDQLSDISPQGDYGGYKQSGFGRTGGLEGLYEFLQVKNIRIGMS